MDLARLSPRTVIRGPMFDEPVRIGRAVQEPGGVRVFGTGTLSGASFDCLLAPAHLEQVAVVEEAGAPADGGRAPAQAGFTFHFLSHVLKRRVRWEGEARPFAGLSDIGVQKRVPYPLAVSLAVRHRRGAERQVIPWSSVAAFGEQEIVVRKTPAGDVPPVDFWLRRDVLDDQVVDVAGAQVLRVNDVHLLYADGRLIVAHVEVGIRGVLRRLRFERAVSALLRWLFDYAIPDKFVSWRHVEVISPGDSAVGVRVSAPPSRLASIHPAELADIMEELGTRERQSVLTSLDAETAAETLEKIDPDLQRSLLTQAEPAKAADILEEMPPSEAAEALRDLADPDAERIIGRMEKDAARDVRTVLAHEEQTAGSVMTTACLEVRRGDRADDVLRRLRAAAHEVEAYGAVYVLDDERHLVGIVSLRDLLGAPPEATIETLMATHLVTVPPTTSLRDLGRLFLKYGFRTIPVVGDESVFLGVVRLRRVLEDLGGELGVEGLS